jgi:TolA-binding protein
VVTCLAGTGCLVLKEQHDELAREVDKLETREVERQEELEGTLARADEQMTTIEERLQEAEKFLRSDQASLGVRVNNLESELSDVRGVAEDTHNELSAVQSSLSEARQDFEQRINNLEAKLNEATNIPEGKQALLGDAETALKRKDYKGARRLFRIFLSRYPEDPTGAEVRFKIGLTFYSERDYRSALGEFYWIVQNAPEAAVIHDALYYSGLAFAKLGQCDKAIMYFGALNKKGSGAPERYQERAKQQIETLTKDAGKLCTGDKGATEEAPAPTPEADQSRK